MFNLKLDRLFKVSIRRLCQRRESQRKSAARQSSGIESLEARTMLSVAASAQLTLVSTTGTPQNPVYNYDIAVKDTGNTNVGTFWFGWVPGKDFLGAVPSSVSSPTGWSDTITGSGDSTDGSAIEWVASSNAITPGNTLSGFSFVTTDSPAALAGNSPDYPGTPAMTATVYSGGAFSDAGFELVVTPAAVQTPVASTTTLASSAPTIIAGNPVTFTATVAPSSGSGTTPTGTVTFLADGNSIGTGAVGSDGTASFQTSSLAAGTYSITAQYPGDSNYTASTSSAITETVNTPPNNAIATTTAVVASAPSTQSGASVTFTATVIPGSVVAAPTGTVNFTSNGTAIGSAAVAADGTATLSTSTLPLGVNSIVASYSGDSLYAASTSTAITETITPPPTLVPAIAKSTLPGAIVAGVASHGVVTLDITNVTSAAIKGKSTIAIFASTTPGIDSSAIQVAQVVRNLNVKTTKPTVTPIPVKLLAGALPAGGYTLFARVTDPSANVGDSTAGPEITVAAPFIALSETVTKSTLPASTASGVKSHASVSLSITNSGNITTTGTTTLALFATTTGVVDGTATQINSVAKPLRIHAGKSTRATIPVKTVPTLASGNYTIIAQVTDGNGQISSVPVATLTITG